MKWIHATGRDDSGEIAYDRFPDTCPHCHFKIVPQHIDSVVDKDSAYFSFFCVREECSRYFVYEYYEAGSNYFLSHPSFGEITHLKFSEEISGISSSFVNIYGQAEQAEYHKLRDISGVGYRKALEFLIKDYIIHKDPTLRPVVENKLLNACIIDHIEDINIINSAKRAAWIGNDETHYVRKWEGLDITHLKQIIGLTIHWIQYEQLAKQILTDMPEPNRKK